MVKQWQDKLLNQRFSHSVNSIIIKMASPYQRLRERNNSKTI